MHVDFSLRLILQDDSAHSYFILKSFVPRPFVSKSLHPRFVLYVIDRKQFRQFINDYVTMVDRLRCLILYDVEF